MSKRVQNRLILWASLVTGILGYLVFYLQYQFQMFSKAMNQATPIQSHAGLYIVMALPLFFAIIAIIVRFRSVTHPSLPILNCLTLTFSSMALIAGSGGFTEFHFSIFMVLAIAAFYDSIPILLIMGAIFVAQQLLGYFYFPRLVFGVSDSLLFVFVQVLFIIFTVAATIWFINEKKKIRLQLTSESDLQQGQLNQLLGQLSSTAMRLTTASKQFSMIASEGNSASQRITDTIMEISVSSERQAAHTGNIEGSIQDMATLLQGISANATKATELAESASDISLQGQSKVAQTVQSIGALQSNVHELAKESEELRVESDAIGEIVEVIKNIASQTNLLALNAAIEAARAGEQGKGFGVVASEIRKLSEGTTDATENIAQKITSIQSRIERTVTAIGSGLNHVNQGLQTSESAGDSIHTIGETADLVKRSIAEVSSSTLGLMNQTNSMVSAIQQLAASSRTVAEGAQEVSASSQQQLASSQEIEASALELLELAEQLEDKVQQLKL